MTDNKNDRNNVQPPESAKITLTKGGEQLDFELDPERADEILKDVLKECKAKTNTIPVGFLEQQGNYRSTAFKPLRFLIYIIIIAIVLVPIMFMKPAVTLDRVNIDTTDYQETLFYTVNIKSVLPIRHVTASLNGSPISVKQDGRRAYTVEADDNGELEVMVSCINGQISTVTYEISDIDKDPPVYVSSYIDGENVVITVKDTYSGLDFDAVDGLTPVSVNEAECEFTFRIPDEATAVTFPDKAGNSITLLIQPLA